MSRILVVEDEAAIAELISINLRHAGFEVTIAGDAEQAHGEQTRPGFFQTGDDFGGVGHGAASANRSAMAQTARSLARIPARRTGAS